VDHLFQTLINIFLDYCNKRKHFRTSCSI